MEAPSPAPCKASGCRLVLLLLAWLTAAVAAAHERATANEFSSGKLVSGSATQGWSPVPVGAPPAPPEGAPRRRLTGCDICETVPVVSTSYCTKSVMVQEAYACPMQAEEQVCRTVPRSVQATCTREVTREEAYPCTQTKRTRQCTMVAKTCRETKEQLETYDCGKQQCRPAKKKIQEQCSRTMEVPVAQPCMKTRLKKVCRQVEEAVPSTCYKEGIREEQYPCTRPEMKTKCRKVPVEVPQTCTRKEMRQEQYTCTKQKEKQQCGLVVVEVPATCTRPVQRTEKYKCVKTEFQTKCKKQAVTVPALCERPVTKAEPQCPVMGVCPVAVAEVQTVTPATGGKMMTGGAATAPIERPATMQAVGHAMIEIETPNGMADVSAVAAVQIGGDLGGDEDLEEWDEGGGDFEEGDWEDDAAFDRRLGAKKKKSRNAPTPCVTGGKEATCQQAPVQMETYPCERIEHKKVCKKVPKKVHATCTRTVAAVEQYSCMQPQQQQQCVAVPIEVPSICTREVPIEVPYTCTRVQLKRQCKKVQVDVPSTCTRQVPEQKAYPCTEMQQRTQCKDQPVPYEATCTELVPRKEAYMCERVIKDTQCTYVPKTCQKMVSLEVDVPCNEERCEDVMIPIQTTCKRPVIKQEAYPCMQTSMQQECVMQPSKKQRTCYRPVMVEKKETCESVSYQTICRPRPVVPSTAPTCKKKKKCKGDS